MTTQRKLLLDHLQKLGSISGMEALYLYQIRALPRRIKDLEEHGYIVKRERKTDNTGRSYVRYHLVDAYPDSVPVFEGYRYDGLTLFGQPAFLGTEYAMELAA